MEYDKMLKKDIIAEVERVQGLIGEAKAGRSIAERNAKEVHKTNKNLLMDLQANKDKLAEIRIIVTAVSKMKYPRIALNPGCYTKKGHKQHANSIKEDGDEWYFLLKKLYEVSEPHYPTPTQNNLGMFP